MTVEGGIETISIHEIPAGTPVFNSVRNISVMEVEDLKAEWDSYTDQEKEFWFTATPERKTPVAKDVIEDIIERMADEGYEEMDVVLRDALPSDAEEKMQAVLNELFDNSAADVYYPEKRIVE